MVTGLVCRRWLVLAALALTFLRVLSFPHTVDVFAQKPLTRLEEYAERARSRGQSRVTMELQVQCECGLDSENPLFSSLEQIVAHNAVLILVPSRLRVHQVLYSSSIEDWQGFYIYDVLSRPPLPQHCGLVSPPIQRLPGEVVGVFLGTARIHGVLVIPIVNGVAPPSFAVGQNQKYLFFVRECGDDSFGLAFPASFGTVSASGVIRMSDSAAATSREVNSLGTIENLKRVLAEKGERSDEVEGRSSQSFFLLSSNF